MKKVIGRVNDCINVKYKQIMEGKLNTNTDILVIYSCVYGLTPEGISKLWLDPSPLDG